jgi:hypothetical protein
LGGAPIGKNVRISESICLKDAGTLLPPPR